MNLLFDIPKDETSIIKVLGVGGGGSNAVNHMFNQGIVGVDFAICNTDIQALEASPVPYRIQLGKDLTDGRGAGSKPNVGKAACLESIDDIKKFLEKDTKMLFVTAGLGGGTGTGAAPIIAKAAKELDILTVGIVTLPFEFEGARRQNYAETGLQEIRKNVDSLIVISNDKLREIYGNLNISEAFAQADNILTTAAKGIAELITITGIINVDFEDVNTVMRESGVSIMGTAQMEGEDRATRAVEAALNSPLLEDNNIRGAEHILLQIASGTKEVTMDEISDITRYITKESGSGTNIIWGNSRNEELGEKIAVTIIATGFDETGMDAHDTTSMTIELEDESGGEGFSETDKAGVTVELNVDNDQNPTVGKRYSKVSNRNTDPYATMSSADQQARKDYLEEEKKRRKKQRDGMVKLNSKTLDKLEKIPAYKRRNMKLDGVEEDFDGFGIHMDTEDSESNKNNYLHKSVD